jgi:hypothetical protein
MRLYLLTYLLTIKGGITINNRKAKEVDMRLTRQIIGNLLNSSTIWEVTQNISYYALLNFSNRVVWKIKAAAVSEAMLTYRYQMYVRP